MTKSIKTICMTLLMTICFAVTCLVLSACGGSDGKGQVFSTSADAFGFAGATAGAFLSKLNVASSSAVNIADSAQVATADQSQKVDILNKYIDIFDSVVGNNAITSTKEHLDDVNYNYKITTTITDLDGSKQTFEMKFKEVKQDNTLVTDDDRDEITSSLSGVMTYNGVEYEISGKKQVERDEVEIEFIAYINQNTRVLVEQETESGEQEFQYSIFNNGFMTDELSVEVETERNEIEVEMQYSKNGVEISYKFEREGNALRIMYRDSTGSGYIRATVSSDGNSISYTFDDGTVITKDIQ